MVFGFIKSIGSHIGNAVQRVGQKVNDVARVGQRLLGRVEKAGEHIGRIPVVGDIARDIYETTPLKDIHHEVRQGLHTVERSSERLKHGDIGGAIREAAKNPHIARGLEDIERHISRNVPESMRPYYNQGASKFAEYINDEPEPMSQPRRIPRRVVSTVVHPAQRLQYPQRQTLEQTAIVPYSEPQSDYGLY